MRTTKASTRYGKVAPKGRTRLARDRKIRKYKSLMDGQVPSHMTYDSWLRGQPEWVQDFALGKGKAGIFRRGELKLSQFTDNRNRSLTLKQLIALEKAS